MAVAMINKWFGIEMMGERFLVRDIAGVHANLATRAEAIAWIDTTMERLTQEDDGPEATADDYLNAE